MNSTQSEKLSYPENLYADIGVNFPDPLPEDFTATLNYVLSTLTEREVIIIKHRYLDGMIYRQIGDMMSLSAESIRRILIKALRKLRHPSRSAPLRYGIRGYYARKLKSTYLEAYDRGYNDGKLAAVPDPPPPAPGQPIEQFAFSIRAMNCLNRAGIERIDQLLGTTVDELYRVRGCGKTTVAEIQKVLFDRGLPLLSEENSS